MPSACIRDDIQKKKKSFKWALPVWGGGGLTPARLIWSFFILGVKVLKRPYNGYISTWKSWCGFLAPLGALAGLEF